MAKETMKVNINFYGDQSVGIFPSSLEWDLDVQKSDFDEEINREELREQFADISEHLFGERCHVFFSDEPTES